MNQHVCICFTSLESINCHLGVKLLLICFVVNGSNTMMHVEGLHFCCVLSCICLVFREYIRCFGVQIGMGHQGINSLVTLYM